MSSLEAELRAVQQEDQLPQDPFKDVPQISGPRLLADLAAFATFGGRPDGGVDRVAGSEADAEGRAWLMTKIQQAGLESRSDPIGNVFGRVRGGRPRILTGSHTDTVPAGGRLDGAYGVIAALEVLRTLHESGHPAAEELEIVGFWDEEGVLPDSNGGLTGSTAYCSGEQVRSLDAFLELHVEQGPRMENAGMDLAVVEGIVGVERYEVTLHGVSNHAGTTPMVGRADAGRAAAKLAGRIRNMVLGVDRTMVANVGFVEFLPGAPNVIPGEARIIVEWRAGSEMALREAESELTAVANWTAGDEDCTAEITRISRKPVAAFNPRLIELAETACLKTGGTLGRLLSYAGHDSSVVSSHVPTAMLFVPSTGGISHSPLEHTPDELLVHGCQALLQTILEVHATPHGSLRHG